MVQGDDIGETCVTTNSLFSKIDCRDPSDVLNKWGQFRRIGNQGPATGPLPSASSITQRAT